MNLISFHQIHHSFAGPKIFSQLDLKIEKGERLCLIGRNGVGKSTLMKIITGDFIPDGGELVRKQGLVCKILQQEVPIGTDESVFEMVARGIRKEGQLIIDYHNLIQDEKKSQEPEHINKLDKLHKVMDDIDGWELSHKIEKVITKMNLKDDDEFMTLSAGMKRRVLLAQAIISEPDILLLDEPTNHLDIESIDWLEDFLLRYEGTIVFVTHDRQFLQTIATRIIEIDFGRTMSYDCDYHTYLERRDLSLKAIEKQDALFDKRLAAEEAWIRKGIKARRTRNEGRVRSLEKMRDVRKDRFQRTGQVKIALQESDKTGRQVIKAEKITFSYENTTDIVVNDFSSKIMRGDKVAIIGPNGVGKTTLIKLLLGQMEPNSGVVTLGTNIELAYFDQLNMALDENKTVFDNIAQGSEYISINGNKKHVLGYLQEFLFSPDRARGSVSVLSGGEKKRLLLAKLFTKPANFLVMDEPTNDLDCETLELLEELLMQFDGTLIIVSHDRAFINNIATSCYVFEGQGTVKEYVGGYDDWVRQRKVNPGSQSSETQPKKASPTLALSESERKELHNLPKQIEKIDKQIAKVHEDMAAADFYERPPEKTTPVYDKLKKLESDQELLYQRWEALEEKQTS
ncbi:MAG: ATP-binding cassette domain-containing protein [Planctomycetes bacterium]|nr:ATP-binding cassette domain-containing protein [Planctomycetota bacterium]